MPPESKTELLKRVSAATFKAVAKNSEISINFHKGSPKVDQDTAYLPETPSKITLEQLREYRGTLDSLALRERYHDKKVFASHVPQNAEARSVFEAIEQVRYEGLGARRMIGVAKNLTALISEDYRAKGYETITKKDNEQISDVISLLAREALFGVKIPKNAEPLMNLWRAKILPKIEKKLAKLNQSVHDQNEFSHITNDILRTLEFTIDDDTSSESQDNDQTKDDENENNSDENNEINDKDEGAGETSTHATEDGKDDGSETDGNVDDDLMSTDGQDEPAGSSNWDQDWKSNKGNANLCYKAFTNQFDEIVESSTLCDPEELKRLRLQLDQQLSNLNSVVSRLANRLQRRLMAKQIRSWEFDLEEGILDAGRLSRVVTDPLHPLSFKLEKDTDFKDTVVSLLIDNSGSMRGRPITVAAMSAEILVRTLERCGVKVEVLGFTTRSWKGGSSREKWVSDNKPSDPGRLNDLRHIIYKSADMPWRRARLNLGLMLREGLLKENIDGEALLWAHQRLLIRPEWRKILMVISDGAPVDDATLSANPGNYLERHLRDVINWIEAYSDVELTAIGIGHDVNRYYRRAVTIVDAEDLGGTMMARLSDLFNEDWRETRGKIRLN